MRISPAAFRHLVEIDAEGEKVVDTANGCIRNLRAAFLIRYRTKANGSLLREAFVTDLGKQLIAQNQQPNS